MSILRIIKIVVKVIPLMGNLFRNKESEDGGKGKFEFKKLGSDLVDLGTAVAIGYLL